MVVGSNPVTVTSPSDFAPASSKEFLDIQATIECGFTLKRVRDMIKTYSQNLIMSAKEEEMFQWSNKCWICDKLFDFVDEKVRDHCHITGKCRGASHFSCNADLKITKKVPVVFHNLRGYDSH